MENKKTVTMPMYEYTKLMADRNALCELKEKRTSTIIETKYDDKTSHFCLHKLYFPLHEPYRFVEVVTRDAFIKKAIKSYKDAQDSILKSHEGMKKELRRARAEIKEKDKEIARLENMTFIDCLKRLFNG